MTAPRHEPRRRPPDTQQGMRRRNLSRVMHTVAAARAAVARRGRLPDRADPGRRLDPGRRADPRRAFSRSWAPAAAAGSAAPAARWPSAARARRDRRGGRRRPSGGLRGRPARRRARRGPSATATNRGRAPGPVVARPGGAAGGRSRPRPSARGCGPAGLAVAVPGLVARDARDRGPRPQPRLARRSDLGCAAAAAGLPLTVDNEANLGALAELWLGDASAARLRARLRRDRHRCRGRGRRAAAARGTRLRGRAGPCAGAPGRVRRAPAAGAAAWSSTRARRPCCAPPGSSRGEGRRRAARRARRRRGDAGTPCAARGGDRARYRADRRGQSARPAGGGARGALSRLAPWLLPSLEAELARRTAGPACGIPSPGWVPRGRCWVPRTTPCAPCSTTPPGRRARRKQAAGRACRGSGGNPNGRSGNRWAVNSPLQVPGCSPAPCRPRICHALFRPNLRCSYRM